MMKSNFLMRIATRRTRLLVWRASLLSRFRACGDVRGASKAADSKEHIIEHCAAKARAKCAMPRNGYGCNVRDRGMFVAAMSSTRVFLRSIRFSQHAAALAIE